jgi:hypothetical protein
VLDLVLLDLVLLVLVLELVLELVLVLVLVLVLLQIHPEIQWIHPGIQSLLEQQQALVLVADHPLHQHQTQHLQIRIVHRRLLVQPQQILL